MSGRGCHSVPSKIHAISMSKASFLRLDDVAEVLERSAACSDDIAKLIDPQFIGASLALHVLAENSDTTKDAARASRFYRHSHVQTRASRDGPLRNTFFARRNHRLAQQRMRAVMMYLGRFSKPRLRSASREYANESSKGRAKPRVPKYFRYNTDSDCAHCQPISTVCEIRCMAERFHLK